MYKQAQKTAASQYPVPDKLFYKIGEVSKITGIESYVLRYWETEFPFLRPRKNKSGQRVYTKKDLDLIIQIKTMLYQERYTIEGVRKRLGEGINRPTGQKNPLDQHNAKDLKNPAEAVVFVRKRLREILSGLS